MKPCQVRDFTVHSIVIDFESEIGRHDVAARVLTSAAKVRSPPSGRQRHSPDEC